MKTPLLTLCGLFLGLSLHAQLYTDSVSLDTMMMDFFNTDSVTVVPSSVNGGGSFAYFEGAMTPLGLNAGIYLSTGEVQSVYGPNTEEGTSGFTQTGANSDPDLEAISMAPILENTVIELDIVPLSDSINFKYVFASEEYCEWVNSSFNDVFGFFVSGPGINGPYADGAINIVKLTDGTPVTINNVNHILNSEYFVPNTESCGAPAAFNFTSFDGFTTPLMAGLSVIPGETYHVKIAVGDAGDAIFDSGVFLDIESLGGDSLLVPPAQFAVTLNGDELVIENTSNYATSYLWDFGDGTTSTERHPAPHAYDVQTPTEFEISLVTQNYCCTDTYTTTVLASPSTSTSQLNANAISIFPNPANDIINIKNFKKEGIVILYNAFGQQVLAQNIAGDSQINIEELPQGIYIMNISNEKGFFNSRKIVIE